jgi:hypothetical protein
VTAPVFGNPHHIVKWGDESRTNQLRDAILETQEQLRNAEDRVERTETRLGKLTDQWLALTGEDWDE